MAVQPVTRIHTQLDPFAILFEWTGLVAGDTGEWLLLGHYADKNLHVFGTFGGPVTFEGSNESAPTDGNAVGLTDATQTLISLTAKGTKQVMENPLYVRPKAGAGVGSITCRLLCRI